jgi:hypothetical protein
MPLARFHLYAQGPEIWIAPMLATAEFWVPTMRHIAREAGCVVLGIAPIMHTDWLPHDLPWLRRIGFQPPTERSSRVAVMAMSMLASPEWLCQAH